LLAIGDAGMAGLIMRIIRYFVLDCVECEKNCLKSWLPGIQLERGQGTSEATVSMDFYPHCPLVYAY